MKKILIASLFTTALLAGCASGPFASSKMAPDMPTRTSDGMLIGPNGHTVYTFAKDSGNVGTSACYDQCAQNWPPLTAASTAKATGDYSIITRTDGTRQWAFKGQPLYYFSKDAKPGDMVGDGALNGAWKTIKP